MYKKFEGIVQLQQAVMQLDEARQKEVFVGENNNPEFKADKYLAVYNIDKKRLSCIATNKYKILQHGDAFGAVVEELKTLNLPVNGFIRNKGDRVDIMVLFNSVMVEIGEDKLQVGVRFSNSYDLTRTFYGEFAGFRLACANQMFLGKVIENIKMGRKHYESLQEVGELVRNFIKEATDNCDTLKEVINIAIEDTYEWELSKKIFEKMITIKKYRKQILVELEEYHGRQITRWDLYNIVTKIATHGEKVSNYAFDWLQNKAQEILVKPIILEKD